MFEPSHEQCQWILVSRCACGGSSSVINCLDACREDGMVYVPYRSFTSSVLLKCIQQAHQDVFGMMEIITVIDYLMVRLRTALYEEWIDGVVTLQRCARARQVSIDDLRAVIEEENSCSVRFNSSCDILNPLISRRNQTQ